MEMSFKPENGATQPPLPPTLGHRKLLTHNNDLQSDRNNDKYRPVMIWGATASTSDLEIGYTSFDVGYKASVAIVNYAAIKGSTTIAIAIPPG